MAPRYRLRRFRRRSTFRRRYPRRYRKTFKKRVRKVMYQLSELKQATLNLSGSVNTGTQYFNMSPNIPQGPGDDERVGNEIMSKNYQLKFRLNSRIKQNPVGAGTQNIWVRILIVYPRKLSNVEATNFINATNFPLNGLIDQDNWIVWMDRWLMLNPTQDFYRGSPKTATVIFNKRFYSKMLFGRYSSVQVEKGPFLIICNDAIVTDQELTISGYGKLSYKDV